MRSFTCNLVFNILLSWISYFFFEIIHINIRNITYFNILNTTSKSGMNITDYCVNLFYETFSAFNNKASILNKLHVPYIKSLHQLFWWWKCYIFEKLVSLIKYFVVINKVTKIYLVKLAKFHIHKSSSLWRTIFYNIKIFRRKENNINNSKKFNSFFYRNTINCYTLGFILLKVHVYAVFHTML